MLLSQEIDTVTDNIEDVLIRIHMYNIKVILPDAIKMAYLIEECCQSLGSALEDLHNFSNKSSKILEYVVAVNDIEEKGDALYFASVHDLFENHADSVRFLRGLVFSINWSSAVTRVSTWQTRLKTLCLKTLN